MINYNTYDLAKNAILSIFEQTKDINYELILIDNKSPDGSGEKLAKDFDGKIKYIQMGENAGTSKAFNRGLSISKGKYVLWINSDIILEENFIKTLFDYMETHPECGICGGNVLDFNHKPHHSFRRKLPSVKTIRRELYFTTIFFKKLFYNHASIEYNFKKKPIEVGYITGADMMVRKELFDKVGPFDEDIFMYFEETEFTFRAKKQTNTKVVCVPNAHILHLEGASFTKDEKTSFSERRFRWFLNGQKMYFDKCYGGNSFKRTLKSMIHKRSKSIIACTLLFKKSKANMFRQEKAILKEYLRKE